MTAAQARTPNANMLLLARASVARKLVRDGVLEPGVALSYAVWPTAAIRERERRVGYGTLTGRAFGTRGNP